MKIDPIIKERLGFDSNESDSVILKYFKDKKKIACKPCWELKYCPYGILIEDFPLLPPSLDKALKQNEYMHNCLKTKHDETGERLNSETEKYYQEALKAFNPEDYIKLPPDLKELECKEWGHICPVYFVASPITETEQKRRKGRYIPFSIKMRVTRRDNYTCQECGKHYREVEFDHIIPVSKGGSSEEHNIRLTCYDCNREKSNNVEI